MKHTMTQLEGKNEPMGFMDVIFGNYFLEVDHGCYLAEPSPIPPYTELELLPWNPIGGNDLCIVNVDSSSIGHSSRFFNNWILYFDASKM